MALSMAYRVKKFITEARKKTVRSIMKRMLVLHAGEATRGDEEENIPLEQHCQGRKAWFFLCARS